MNAAVSAGVSLHITTHGEGNFRGISFSRTETTLSVVWHILYQKLWWEWSIPTYLRTLHTHAQHFTRTISHPTPVWTHQTNHEINTKLSHRNVIVTFSLRTMFAGKIRFISGITPYICWIFWLGWISITDLWILSRLNISRQINDHNEYTVFVVCCLISKAVRVDIFNQYLFIADKIAYYITHKRVYYSSKLLKDC